MSKAKPAAYVNFGSPNPEAQTGSKPNVNISIQQLWCHDGTDPDKPIYMAIKGLFPKYLPRNLRLLMCTTGVVFNVTVEQMLQRDGIFNIYAGNDASRALGMVSLQRADAIADFSTLSESEMVVLNDWFKVFECVQN